MQLGLVACVFAALLGSGRGFYTSSSSLINKGWLKSLQICVFFFLGVLLQSLNHPINTKGKWWEEGPLISQEEHGICTSLRLHGSLHPSCLLSTLWVLYWAYSVLFNHAKWHFVPVEMIGWLPSFLQLMWWINWSIFKCQDHLHSGINPT